MMIDLDNMHVNIFLCSSSGERISMLRDEVIELITRLREAEKDAARYRWLRDTFGMDEMPELVWLNLESGWGCNEAKSIDMAIDQAMKGKGYE